MQLSLKDPDKRARILAVLLSAIIAGGYAGSNAWLEQEGRVYPLDLDGWGHLVGRLEMDYRFAALFEAPSLWKGPIVPFFFGLSYYLVPIPEAVLAFNVLAFSAAAGLWVAAFSLLGARPRIAALGVLLGMLYFPHRYIFGYYFAEPFLALLAALTFLFTACTLKQKSSLLALLTGLSAGVLLLSRAPFILVVIGLPWMLWIRTRRAAAALWFLLGLAVAFAPWGIRNYLVHGAYIPFTAEGGMILFQGTYLRGDDGVMDELRQLPDFQAIEARERKKPLVEQYRSWQQAALAQIQEDVPGQIGLCVRKAIRFWVYLPQYSWTPGWKTLLIALVGGPLACVGIVAYWREPLVQVAALWVVGLWAFHAVVHAELRYNYPVLPPAFLLSVLGACRLWGRSGLGRRDMSS